MVVGLVLNRHVTDFSERDRLLLNLLQPHVQQAFANAEVFSAVQHELASLREAVETSAREWRFSCTPGDTTGCSGAPRVSAMGGELTRTTAYRLPQSHKRNYQTETKVTTGVLSPLAFPALQLSVQRLLEG
jgi:hypothetical protein